MFFTTTSGCHFCMQVVGCVNRRVPLKTQESDMGHVKTLVINRRSKKKNQHHVVQVLVMGWIHCVWLLAADQIVWTIFNSAVESQKWALWEVKGGRKITGLNSTTHQLNSSTIRACLGCFVFPWASCRMTLLTEALMTVLESTHTDSPSGEAPFFQPGR